MITRRNIRVKVMQLLYINESLEENKPVSAQVILEKKFQQTRSLFIYLLYFITEVARYAERDAKIRAAKNLPTAEDLHVNIKIAGNEVLWRIIENNDFKKVADKNILFEDSGEWIKKIYAELVKSEKYLHYIQQQNREKKEELEIMLFIFTDLMLPHEAFTAHVEEHFTNWDDDAELMNQLVKNYLQKPGSFSINDMVGEEKRKFAIQLYETVIEKKEYLTSIIKPKLKNWDADRIALLDMILMQMGIAELLYFETIPPKVTINEYIDIAKEYSTPQSGQFINGILDNIHKELIAENKIHKIDYRQKHD